MEYRRGRMTLRVPPAIGSCTLSLVGTGFALTNTLPRPCRLLCTDGEEPSRFTLLDGIDDLRHEWPEVTDGRSLEQRTVLETRPPVSIGLLEVLGRVRMQLFVRETRRRP